MEARKKKNLTSQCGCRDPMRPSLGNVQSLSLADVMCTLQVMVWPKASLLLNQAVCTAFSSSLVLWLPKDRDGGKSKEPTSEGRACFHSHFELPLTFPNWQRQLPKGLTTLPRKLLACLLGSGDGSIVLCITKPFWALDSLPMTHFTLWVYRVPE